MGYSRIYITDLVLDGQGKVLSGTAQLQDLAYNDRWYSNDSRFFMHKREDLGQILSLAEDQKSGDFLSPTRGPVHYDLASDTFTPLQSKRSEDDPLPKHINFGEAYLLFALLEKYHLMPIFQYLFRNRQDLMKMYALLFHALFCEDENVSCSDFLDHSSLAYLFDTLGFLDLDQNEEFFECIGDETWRMDFFKAFYDWTSEDLVMFGAIPTYMDTEKIPFRLIDNPFCELAEPYGSDVRFALIMDGFTRLPMWFELINTESPTYEFIDSSLDLFVDTIGLYLYQYYLDSPYDYGSIRKETDLDELDEDGVEISVTYRLSEGDDSPYRELFDQAALDLLDQQHAFTVDHRSYTAAKLNIKFDGYPSYAYLYVDLEKAAEGFAKYGAHHPKTYEALPQIEKDWQQLKDGYFVLLGNDDEEPSYMLKRYHLDTSFEHQLKSLKPIQHNAKKVNWSKDMAFGKILFDLIVLIIKTRLEDDLQFLGYSISELRLKTSAIIAGYNDDGTFSVDPIHPETNKLFRLLGLSPFPQTIDLEAERERLLKLVDHQVDWSEAEMEDVTYGPFSDPLDRRNHRYSDDGSYYESDDPDDDDGLPF